MSELLASTLSHADARSIVGTTRAVPSDMVRPKGLGLFVLGFRKWPASRARFMASLCLLPVHALVAVWRRSPSVLVLEHPTWPTIDDGGAPTLAPPSVVVVTSVVATRQAEGVHTEWIAAEIGALIRRVPPSGLIVLPRDTPFASILDHAACTRVVEIPGRATACAESAVRAVCTFLGVPDPVVSRVLAEPGGAPEAPERPRGLEAALERAVVTYMFCWARLVLRARRPLIVGVTGSVGKTTTKEAVAAALMHRDVRPLVGLVWKAPPNVNTINGMLFVILGYSGWPRSLGSLVARVFMAPLRALALATVAPYPKILVLEYAAGPGSRMARKAALAPPTVAVVTAIGPAHLEHFGTVERLAEEKADLVRRVPASGLVILGGDNTCASSLDRYARAPVVKVRGRGRALSQNAARAVCAYLRIPEPIAERAVTEPVVVHERLETLELETATVIDDSFNANPLSMALGLDTLAERASDARRRVAILGEMRELGVEARRYHREVGVLAHSRADLVIGVGPLARHYEPHRWFRTARACADALPDLVAAGDVVLVKGSHAVHLDRVVRELKVVALWRS